MVEGLALLVELLHIGFLQALSQASSLNTSEKDPNCDWRILKQIQGPRIIQSETRIDFKKTHDL